MGMASAQAIQCLLCMTRRVGPWKGRELITVRYDGPLVVLQMFPATANVQRLPAARGGIRPFRKHFFIGRQCFLIAFLILRNETEALYGVGHEFVVRIFVPQPLEDGSR